VRPGLGARRAAGIPAGLALALLDRRAGSFQQRKPVRQHPQAGAVTGREPGSAGHLDRSSRRPSRRDRLAEEAVECFLATARSRAVVMAAAREAENAGTTRRFTILAELGDYFGFAPLTGLGSPVF
jgi:hypothetical protein